MNTKKTRALLFSLLFIQFAGWCDDSGSTYSYSDGGNPHETPSTTTDSTGSGSTTTAPCGGCNGSSCSCSSIVGESVAEATTAAETGFSLYANAPAYSVNYQERIDAVFEKNNSVAAGDPVLVTSGVYVSSDEELGVLRTYRSDSQWSFGTDVRIIRGIAAFPESDIFRARALLAEIEAKIAIVKKIYEIKGGSYGDSLGELEALRVKTAEAAAGLVAMNERRRSFSALNADALRADRYSDFSPGDEKVGNDNLVLVDETGTPLLFLYRGEGVWTPARASESRCVRLESVDGLDALESAGFILRERGGRVRYFDRRGLIEKVVPLDGSATRYVRSPATHEITSIERPHNYTIAVRREKGRMTSLSGPEGLSVRYSWNGTQLASVTDSDGDTVRYEYADGRLSRIIKGDGSAVEIRFGYETGGGNSLRLVSSTVNEEQAAETFEYAPSERTTIHVDAAGLRTVYRYDAMQRTTRIESPDGTVTENEYDGSSGLLSIKKINGDITRYEYDDRGNRTRARYSDGSFETWTWDEHDLETAHIDRDGYGSWTARDGAGRVTSMEKGKKGGASIRTYSAVWDAQGNLARERYGEQNEYRMTWDANGYPSSRSIDYDGGSATEAYAYDKAGRLSKKTDANGLITRYEYPARDAGSNRVVVERLPSGLSRTMEWNSRKDLVRVTETDSVTGETRVTEAAYDRRHLLRKSTDAAGRVSEFVWTPDGKPALVRLGPWTTAYDYDSSSGALVSKMLSKEGSPETGGGSVRAKIEDVRLPDGSRTTIALSSSAEAAADAATGIRRSVKKDNWGRVVSSVNALSEETSIGVTPAGRIAREQLSWGGFNEYAFDPFTGEISSRGREGHARRSFTYHADGTPLSSTDELGGGTAYECDGRGFVVKESSALGEKILRYDAGGRIIRFEIDSGGFRQYSDISYDDEGRTVTVVDGGKYSTRWKLNAWGECIARIDGEGGELKFVRDGDGAVVREIDAFGKSTVYGINALGLVESMTAPSGIKTEYEYDCQGLPVRVSVSGRIVWSGSYDCEGRLLAEKGWPGIDRSYRYDPCGRLTFVSSGGEIVEEYSYADRGKKMSFMDGNYAIDRDEFGRVVSETNGDGRTMQFSCDDADRLLVSSAFSGRETRFEYGASGSESVRYRDGFFSSITRTLSGRIVEASAPTGTIKYIYDEGGLLVRQEDSGSGDITTYAYDRAGRRVSLKNRDRNISYAYDRNGRLSSICDSAQKLSASLTRDDDGRVTSLAFGNGHRIETLYDSCDRIEAIREKDASRSIVWGEAYAYDEQGRKRCSVRDDGSVELYEYDRQSRLSTVLYPYTAEQSAHDRETAVRFGLCFSQDAGHPELYRFSLEERYRFAALASMLGCTSKIGFSEPVLRESYEYDRRGNRIATETAWGYIRSTYDRNNRLVASGDITYIYDLDGNLISEKSLRESSNYEYTDANRMKHSSAVNLQTGQASSTSYAYDAFGRRTLVHDAGAATMRTSYDAFSFDVLKEALVYSDGSFTAYGDACSASSENQSSENRYAWLGDNSVRTDSTRSNASRSGVDASVAGSKAASSRFAGISCSLYAEGSQIASFRTPDATSTSIHSSAISDDRIYFASDMFGSMRSVSDEAGRRLARFDYDAFGTPVSGDYSVSLPSGYSGKSWDSATRLYNYGYRDYAPTLARFTTVDPICDGNNWYAYAGNDPVDFIDPDGLQLILAVNKDTQTLTATLTLGGISMSETVPVTTGVVPHDSATNTNRSKVQANGTNPTQFPNGTSSVTGTKPNPIKDKNGKLDTRYGETWITTDATQRLTDTRTGKSVKDVGYQIHETWASNTDGCIGVPNKDDMNTLLNYVRTNERQDPGTTQITVTGGVTEKKKNDSCSGR